jgi:hypothetical protein
VFKQGRKENIGIANVFGNAFYVVSVNLKLTQSNLIFSLLSYVLKLKKHFCNFFAYNFFHKINYDMHY